MNPKLYIIYLLIAFISVLGKKLNASISPCTPVFPFVQKSKGSEIIIESVPYSPYTDIRKGETRVYRGKQLLYIFDFYLYNQYVITDSSGLNLVILDRYSLDYYRGGNFISSLKSYNILTKHTRDSLREKYSGITDVSDSYFLDHGIQVCEIAKAKKRKINIGINSNDLFVKGNNLHFRTIENKWVVFDLTLGEILNNQNLTYPNHSILDIERTYKFLKYPKLKNIKTVEGDLLSKIIANKLNMIVADWDSDDLKLIFDISFDRSGSLLSESELTFFFSTDKFIMDEVELRREELNNLIQAKKLKVNVPKELPNFQTKLELYLKKATNNR